MRIERLETKILRELSSILQNDVKNTKVGFCTVTSVEVTNDLSYAKVYVSFLGDEDRKEVGLKGLESSKSFIRTLLAKRIQMRKVPELRFVLDETLDYGNKIEKILEDLKK